MLIEGVKRDYRKQTIQKCAGNYRHKQLQVITENKH